MPTDRSEQWEPCGPGPLDLAIICYRKDQERLRVIYKRTDVDPNKYTSMTLHLNDFFTCCSESKSDSHTNKAKSKRQANDDGLFSLEARPPTPLTREDYKVYYNYATAIVEGDDDPQAFASMLMALNAAVEHPCKKNNDALWNAMQNLARNKSSQNAGLLSQVLGIGLRVLGWVILAATAIAVISILAPALAPATTPYLGMMGMHIASGLLTKAITAASYYATLAVKYYGGASLLGQLGVAVAQLCVGVKMADFGYGLHSDTKEKREMINKTKEIHARCKL